jgi:hypothetical protein
MKTKIYLLALVACGLVLAPGRVFAEDDELAADETALTEPSKRETYITELKEKYSLTDEQVKQMQDQGLTNPQLAMAAQLAQTSGKPLEDVLKMRTEQKMGWGKIAKELGVAPSEIGKSVSSLRHAVNEKRKEEKLERKEARKELRDQKKAERKEQRDQRKSDRSKGKG